MAYIFFILFLLQGFLLVPVFRFSVHWIWHLCSLTLLCHPPDAEWLSPLRSASTSNQLHPVVCKNEQNCKINSWLGFGEWNISYFIQTLHAIWEPQAEVQPLKCLAWIYFYFPYPCCFMVCIELIWIKFAKSFLLMNKALILGSPQCKTLEYLPFSHLYKKFFTHFTQTFHPLSSY